MPKNKKVINEFDVEIGLDTPKKWSRKKMAKVKAFIKRESKNQIGILSIKYKPIHKSWEKKSLGVLVPEILPELVYLKGAQDFRKRTLEALELFSVLSNEQVFRHNGTLYYSARDLKKLIEGLYADK